MLIKVVMKILANSLKVLIAKLTGEHQTSFVSGRPAVDNIILAQKMMHSLTKKAGNKGGMILKVDIEKAYDRVALPHLHEVIRAAGFSSHLTDLIMPCISSTSLTFLWNGKRLESIQPQGGLRQGNSFVPIPICSMYGDTRTTDLLCGNGKAVEIAQNFTKWDSNISLVICR